MEASSSRSDLEEALGDRHRRFKVETPVASYACCGKAWAMRAGYDQTYYGFVKAVNDEGFHLVNLGLGTITYQVRVPWSCKPALSEGFE